MSMNVYELVADDAIFADGENTPLEGFWAFDEDMNAMIPVEPVIDGEQDEFTAAQADLENGTGFPMYMAAGFNPAMLPSDSIVGQLPVSDGDSDGLTVYSVGSSGEMVLLESETMEFVSEGY